MDPIRQIVINTLRNHNDGGSLGINDPNNVWTHMYEILAADGIAVLAPPSTVKRSAGYVLTDHPMAIEIQKALAAEARNRAVEVQHKRIVLESVEKQHTEALERLNAFSAAVKPPATPDGSLT